VVALQALPGCAGGSPPNGTAEAPTDTVRVLAYNIHHGEGMDEALDLDRIAALIRRVAPDLVALQEVDSVTRRTDGVDQAMELGFLTGLEPVFGRFMPYQGGAYGMAILSRWPVAESRNLRLPDGEEPRTSLAVRVESPTTGRSLRFVGVHFYRTEVERLAQAARLEELLAEVAIPTVLAGDFNSTPGSAVMTRLGRSWVTVDKGADRFTYPSYDPAREIDFVLLAPPGRFEVLSEHVVDAPVASDHRPVVVDLILRD
jgi:endonuclease/exonuclease/phosphatase family metal-dependent hydrolase